MAELDIERTTTFATVVGDLPAAWAFVMERIDTVGPDPRITISPMWRVTEDATNPRCFEVSVSGMVHEQEPQGSHPGGDS